MIDGGPIVAIATGLRGKSANRKTGDMVQVWILRDDMHPILANRTGADKAICGSCVHMGKATPDRTKGWAAERSCYVNLVQGPGSIYRAFVAGSYATLPLPAFAAAVAGRGLRLGAYGDPAAVPQAVWDAVCPSAAYVNGYTHQWRSLRFSALAAWCMASADSETDRAAAGSLGWRTFRVAAPDADVAPGEVVCPASEEAGKRATCAQCKACGGHSAKTPAGRRRPDVTIVVHGGGRTNFLRPTKRIAA
jgi:hypothetical protein